MWLGKMALCLWKVAKLRANITSSGNRRLGYKFGFSHLLMVYLRQITLQYYASIFFTYILKVEILSQTAIISKWFMRNPISRRGRHMGHLRISHTDRKSRAAPTSHTTRKESFSQDSVPSTFLPGQHQLGPNRTESLVCANA